MISVVVMAVGLALILEGLVYALAPSFIEELLKMFAEMPMEKRRQIGLLVVALGALLIYSGSLLA